MFVKNDKNVALAFYR